jgi:hypothetical protein
VVTIPTADPVDRESSEAFAIYHENAVYAEVVVDKVFIGLVQKQDVIEID